MTTKKQLIDATEFHGYLEDIRQEYLEEDTLSSNFAAEVIETVQDEYLAKFPTVDAVEVPPVNIGDTVWFIIRGKIYKAEIVLLQWCKRENRIDSEIRGEVYGYHCVGATFSDWGKTVFSTKEEAEKALHPCENCFCGTYRNCDGCSYGERRTEHGNQLE